MTVKCLKAVDKAYIADSFTSKTQTITELAFTYEVSRRTIIRVLEEQFIDPGIRRRNRKVKPIAVEQQLTFPDQPVYPRQRALWLTKLLKFVGIPA